MYRKRNKSIGEWTALEGISFANEPGTKALVSLLLKGKP